MITWEEACENPEWMIKHKNDLKNIKIFGYPWYRIFRQYPYLYREFSDRFNELSGMEVAYALRLDPTLVLDLKEYLHRINGGYFSWVLGVPPKLSLCMKYKDDPDKFEAAYYITFPYELNNLNKEEKREMGKKITGLLEGEKT
jgi:hypothetical protein